MDKNREIAIHVIELLGGKLNIVNSYHCMTRLRFNLKNTNTADLNGLKMVKGVLGVQNSSGEIQVIIGPAVEEVYKEVIALTGLEEEDPIHENLDSIQFSEKQKFTPKKLFDSILNAFSAVMAPLIPLFVVVGMANVIAAVIGPSMLNLVGTDSAIYTNFYYIGQSIIYFLPVLAAFTASKKFGSNILISMALACLLLYPDLMSALSADGGYTVYGISAPNISYSSQLIPILLIVWVQSHIEKILNKWIPKVFNVLLVPFCTMAVMLPLGLCLLGPLGFGIGSMLSNFLTQLYQTAGPIETMIVCAFIPFMTAFGIGKPIFFSSLTVLMSAGVEYSYMGIAMVLNNWLAMGVAAGYIVKSRSPEKKQYGLTSLAANFLGGVSEPTLFGIILPNRKTYLPIMVGGAVSGFYFGLMKVGYYQFGASNFFNVMGFIGGEGNSNFINGCIASALAFGVTFVMMLLTYKESEKK